MSNSLSPLASAEMTRRLVQHDIVSEQFRWPGLTSVDQQTILYGAEETLFFGDQKWGGMTADPAIYLQNALDINRIDQDLGEDWRIFSKLGAGYSGYRFVGEVTSNVSNLVVSWSSILELVRILKIDLKTKFRLNSKYTLNWKSSLSGLYLILKIKSYGCFPGLNGGLELTVATRTSIPLDTDLFHADQEAAVAFGHIVAAVMNGELQ